MGGIFDIRILEKLFNIIWFENLRLSLPSSLYTLIGIIDCYIAGEIIVSLITCYNRCLILLDVIASSNSIVIVIILGNKKGNMGGILDLGILEKLLNIIWFEKLR